MIESAAERSELDAVLTHLETTVGALARAIEKLNGRQLEKPDGTSCVLDAPSLSMQQEPSTPMEAGERTEKQKPAGLADHLVQLQDRVGCLSGERG